VLLDLVDGSVSTGRAFLHFLGYIFLAALGHFHFAIETHFQKLVTYLKRKKCNFFFPFLETLFYFDFQRSE
jgi:hypothetical protein